jgi:translation initiation factor IF-2
LAVRIYSLAKELKVDSKELVDLCTQIGITGKGSALASLSEDEVVKIQDYFKGSGPKSPPQGRPRGARRSGAPA